MWGDDGVAGPFEDLHVLVIVVVGMATFLASVSAAYLGYVRFEEDLRFQRDAFEALDRIAAYPQALHDGTPGLLDLDRLSALNASSLRTLVGAYGFRLLLTDGRGTEVIGVASGPTGTHYRGAVAAVSVWASDTNVWVARLGLSIWRT